MQSQQESVGLLWRLKNMPLYQLNVQFELYLNVFGMEHIEYLKSLT